MYRRISLSKSHLSTKVQHKTYTLLNPTKALFGGLRSYTDLGGRSSAQGSIPLIENVLNQQAKEEG